MPRMEIDFEAEGDREFARAAHALLIEKKRIPREVERIIQKHARKLARKARRRVMQEPALKDDHTGLRERIAAGVQVVTLEGEQEHEFDVRVITTMAEEDEAMLPRGMDSPVQGWRHPVFGQRNNWVTQRGKFSWFMESMDDSTKMIPSVTKQVEDAADHIAEVS